MTPETAAKIIDRARLAGMSDADIAAACDLSERGVRDLRTRKRSKIHGRTARAMRVLREAIRARAEKSVTA